MNRLDGPRCACCGSRGQRFLRDLFDDRYGHPGRFNLTKCATCGHVWLDAPPKQDGLYAKYYTPSVQQEGSKERNYRRTFGSWLAGESARAFTDVPPATRVLDIGCGTGRALVYHKQRGCKVTGVEPNHYVASIAKQKGVRVHTMSAEEVGVLDDQFDYITLDQVIEHLQDPVRVLASLPRLLGRNGRILVSTPNVGGWGPPVFGARWLHWHVPYHINHFTMASLSAAAGKAGLRVRSAATLTPSFWLDHQLYSICARPQCGEHSLFWTAREHFHRTGRLGQKIIRLAQRSGILAISTRILDMAALGDCLKATLEPAK